MRKFGAKSLAALVLSLVMANSSVENAKAVPVATSGALSLTSFKPLDFQRDARKPARQNTDIACLAKGIYFEARGEAVEGQYAVGRVILNRVLSRYYPDTACGVVFQNAHKKNRCQFSFACDGRADEIKNIKAWAKAVEIAETLTCDFNCAAPDIQAAIHASTHYHTTKVSPSWSRKLEKTGQIGAHIFYFAERR